MVERGKEIEEIRKVAGTIKRGGIFSIGAGLFILLLASFFLGRALSINEFYGILAFFYTLFGLAFLMDGAYDWYYGAKIEKLTKTIVG